MMEHRDTRDAVYAYSDEAFWRAAGALVALREEAEGFRRLITMYRSALDGVAESSAGDRFEGLGHWRAEVGEAETLRSEALENIGGARAKLANIERRIAEAPAEWHRARVAPPGVWLRHGDEGYRLDVDDAGHAVIRTEPWEVVAAARSGALEDVEEARRLQGMGRLARIRAKHPVALLVGAFVSSGIGTFALVLAIMQSLAQSAPPVDSGFAALWCGSMAVAAAAVLHRVLRYDARSGRRASMPLRAGAALLAALVATGAFGVLLFGVATVAGLLP